MLTTLLVTGSANTSALALGQTEYVYDVFRWDRPQETGIYTYTSGQQEVKVTDDHVYGQVFAQGDWLYYMKIDEIEYRSGNAQRGELYKIKRDGTARTKLLQGEITSMSVEGDFIFYTRYDSANSDYSIYKMKLDGSAVVNVSTDRSFGLQVANGWIYYVNVSDSTYLYRMKTDGTEKTKWIDAKFGNLGEDSFFHVAGDAVMYTAFTEEGHGTFLVKGDGTGKVELDIENAKLRKVIGNKLYFTSHAEDFDINRPAFLYTVGLDGQGMKKVAAVLPARAGATFIDTSDHSIIYRTGAGQIIKVVEQGRVESAYDISSDHRGITVRIDGLLQTYDQPPVTINDRTMVPLRSIFEALGAEIHWDADTSTVKAVKGGTTVSLQIGAVIALKNGNPIELDTAAQIVGGRSMVPVRFVAEALGADVSWDGGTQTVYIYR